MRLDDLDADNPVKHRAKQSCKSRSQKIRDILMPLNDMGEKERCQQLLRRLVRFT